MQNGFGLKDFFMMVLIVGVGIVALLGMIESDRQHGEIQGIENAVKGAETQLQNIRAAVEENNESLREEVVKALREEVVILRSQIDRLGESAGGVSVAGGGNGTAAAEDDNSAFFPWARPGYRVHEPQPVGFVEQPESQESFQAGGEFVEIFEAQLPKITPYFFTDVYGRRIVDGPVCESLAVYHPVTLELAGVLAEAWQVDPEGMWLRARIRTAARFSDGEPVTADDFVFTFHDYIMNPAHDLARQRSTLDVIEEVVAVSDKVVEFRFKKPQFTNKSAALRMYVVPRHFYEQFTPSQLNEATGLLLGSGPYKLPTLEPDNQWKQGDPVVLVRNENYWGDRAPIDSRRYIVRQNEVPRLTAFENGEGDMMRPTPSQYIEKTRDAVFTDRAHTLNWINMRSGYAFIAWNTGERNGRLTPFHDKRVRQAMTMLIDREAFVRDIVSGLGEVATGPFPAGGPQENPDIVPWPYDPERAQGLLAEAGWIDRDNDGILENEQGQEFEFEYMRSSLTSAVSRRSVAFLEESFRRGGIRMILTVRDWSVLQDDVGKRDFDAVSFAWSASAPESDPNQLWHSDSIADAGDNFSQWRNDEKDSLIEQGRATLDDDERFRIWHRLHEVIHDEQPYTFLYNPDMLRFISRDIGNVHPYSSGLHINEMFVID